MYANDDANITISIPVKADGIVAVGIIYSTGHLSKKNKMNLLYFASLLTIFRIITKMNI